MQQTTQSTQDAVRHAFTRAWTGAPGDCGGECTCGLLFDNFASTEEAADELNRHLDANTVKHPSWCSDENCWAYPVAQDKPEDGGEPAPGGFHESDYIEIPTSNTNRWHTLAVRAELDHGKPDAGVEVTLATGREQGDAVIFLSAEQAAALRDALDSFLEDGDNPIVTAFKLGCEIYQRKYLRAMHGHVKRYAQGYTDALDGRPAAFEVEQ